MEAQRNEAEQGKYKKLICPICKATLNVSASNEVDYTPSKANSRVRCPHCRKNIVFSVKK